MNAALQHIHAIGTAAWLRFVQALNALTVALLGGALVVHTAYPQLISGAVAKLPPAIGIPLIFLFGVIVHYAIRRAKVSPND